MAELKEGGLTGARRFRYHDMRPGPNWPPNPVLLLQVQYNTWIPASETRPDAHWATLWRDATPEDITAAEVVV